MRSKKRQWWKHPWIITAKIVIVSSYSFSTISCAKVNRTPGAESTSPREVSMSLSSIGCKENLRKAQVAAETGNDGIAESELKLCLKEDPQNSQALSTLASLYAKQAGISIQDGLNLFILAGQQLSEKSSDHSYTPVLGAPLAPGDEVLKERVDQINNEARRLSAGASLAVKVFQSIPLLTPVQMQKLDIAIYTLRPANLSPQDRSEQNRMDLAALSFVRLVNHLKHLIGDSKLNDFAINPSFVCALDLQEALYRLHEIGTSLIFIEEGLLTQPTDTQTLNKNARIHAKRLISTYLKWDGWDKLDSYFDGNLETGKAARIVGLRFCGKYDEQWVAQSLPQLVEVNKPDEAEKVQVNKEEIKEDFKDTQQNIESDNENKEKMKEQFGQIKGEGRAFFSDSVVVVQDPNAAAVDSTQTEPKPAEQPTSAETTSAQ